VRFCGDVGWVPVPGAGGSFCASCAPAAVAASVIKLLANRRLVHIVSPLFRSRDSKPVPRVSDAGLVMFAVGCAYDVRCAHP